MKKLFLGLFLAVGMLMAQTVPAGYQAVQFGSTTIVVPALTTMAQNTVTQMENESILSLVGEGMVNTQSVVSNLTAVATNYCQMWPTLTGCNTTANMNTVLAPYIAQLKTAFNLVPASQWNPSTFSANTYVNAIGFLNAQKNNPVNPVKPPTLIVNTATCTFVSGINGPSGTECGAMVGVTLAQLQALGGYVSQGGVLYQVHIVQGLMGYSWFFTPVTQ